MSKPLILENDLYRVEVSPLHGLITRLLDKQGKVELIAERRLADNFRLLLPLPGIASNYILGSEQKLTVGERLVAPDVRRGIARGRTAQPPPYVGGYTGFKLHWAGPLQNERGKFKLAVTLRIELVGEAVHFRCQVRNDTRHQLAEVWYPIIGGMMGLAKGDAGRDTEVLLPTPNSNWRKSIFRDFGNTRGQMLGTLSGEHGFCYPGFMSMPWASFFHEKRNRALYFAGLEPTPRVKVIRFALDPGLADQREGGNWPRAGEVGDLPTGLTMNLAHFPYTKPGETFEGSTVVLQCHDGGWRESAALYRQWFTAHHPVVKPASSWMRRETAFLHTMFLLPEDNINLRFTEMPRWAKSAKDYGVNHIMLAGWQVGGHDRGYPYYTPDPRLGTWKELEAGIRAAHKLGLRVSFFVNCQPIDMTTEWYKRELRKYRVLDPHGEQYFIINYWGMGTLGARTRFVTATPFTEMNPYHPEVRRLLIRQFRKLAEIGADGIHIDKFFGTPFDFNPRLKGTSPDRAQHEGMLKFVEELLAECRQINPEFCFSSESSWDRLLSYSDLNWWGPADDTMKEVFPQRALCAGIEQPYDYNKVNHAVLRGGHLLVGPANYIKGMDYLPMKKLCEYIREITRIRRELFAFLSAGVLGDASEGLFRRRHSLVRMGGPFANNPHARWTVFRESSSGRRAVVLANLGSTSLEARGLKFADTPTGHCRVYQPFKGTNASRLPVTIAIPSERLAVLVEEQ
jgi:hypothetical protein